MLRVNAHGVQARLQSTLSHLISILKSSSYWCSASSSSKLFDSGPGAGSPSDSEIHRASFACHGMHVVSSQTRRRLLPQTWKHLMHFTDPALLPATISCADSLMQSSSGTRLPGTVTWDTKMDFLVYCSAMCKMTVATSPLHRPGSASDSCNFQNGPLGVLVRFSSFGRQSVGKLVTRKHA